MDLTQVQQSNGKVWFNLGNLLPPPPKSFLSISKTKSNQSLLKVKHFRPKSCLLFNKAIFNKKKLDPHLFCFIFYRYSRQQTPLTFVKWNEILENSLQPPPLKKNILYILPCRTFWDQIRQNVSRSHWRFIWTIQN